MDEIVMLIPDLGQNSDANPASWAILDVIVILIPDLGQNSDTNPASWAIFGRDGDTNPGFGTN